MDIERQEHGGNFFFNVYTSLKIRAPLIGLGENFSWPQASIGIPGCQFLRINYQRYQVFVDNKMLPLTLTEFKLLTFLCDRPHVVLTRDTLLDVIGKDINVIDRNVDVHILSIRRKLGKYRHTIRTIRGVGYAYEVDV